MGQIVHQNIMAILEDIFSLSTYFDFIAWSHVKSEKNYVAHHLARLVPFDVCQLT